VLKVVAGLMHKIDLFGGGSGGKDNFTVKELRAKIELLVNRCVSVEYKRVQVESFNQ
jgi:hypothetical protein